MSPYDVLKSGHQALLASLAGITADQADGPHLVNRRWNLKGLLAHLVGHEHLLEDVLDRQLSDGASMQYILEYRSMTRDHFNDIHVEMRQHAPYQEVLAELNSSHEHALKTLYLFTPEMLSKPRVASWFQDNYSVTDFLQANHDHKLHHAAQILEFKRLLTAQSHIPFKQ